MKSRLLTLLTMISAFAALALTIPVQVFAQAPEQHPHYKLIDLGTLGGPHSYGSANGEGFQLLNNQEFQVDRKPRT